MGGAAPRQGEPLLPSDRMTAPCPLQERPIRAGGRSGAMEIFPCPLKGRGHSSREAKISSCPVTPRHLLPGRPKAVPRGAARSHFIEEISHADNSTQQAYPRQSQCPQDRRHRGHRRACRLCSEADIQNRCPSVIQLLTMNAANDPSRTLSDLSAFPESGHLHRTKSRPDSYLANTPTRSLADLNCGPNDRENRASAQSPAR